MARTISVSLIRGMIVATCVLFLMGSCVLADMNDGLVAYYPLNGNANDVSGHGLNGVLYNASFADGYYGQGLMTTGASDSFVEVQPNTLLSPTNAVSISLWFKATSFPTWHSCLVYKAGATPTSNGFCDRSYSLWAMADGGIHFTSTASGASSQTTLNSPAGSVQANRFTNVVAIVDTAAQTMKIYVDGSLTATGSYGGSSILAGDFPLRLGGPFNTVSDQSGLSGVLDDVRIYNRALSEQEVLALAQAPMAYSGGNGTAGNPYQIANANDLLALAANTSDYDKCFILTADIDMQGQVFTTAIIAADTNSTFGFQGTAFTGTFDGNGHKITGFTIDDGNNFCLGLFGQINSGGSVKGLGLENCSVSSLSNSYYVGRLVGWNSGSISHCYSTGQVNGGSNSQHVGGLVGMNWGYSGGGNISNCYSTGTVSGGELGGYVGGLAGSNSGNISNCYSTNPVSGGFSYVGGLVGENGGNISNCYSTGTVSGGELGGDVGGLAGGNDGRISNCYSTGAVSSSSGVCVGGLAGYNANGGNGGSISNCYSTGTVSGSSEVGGLVGMNDEDSSVSGSFWDTQTSAQTIGVGYGSAAGISGMTTAQMKMLSTFTSAGWDFLNTWWMPSGSYPRLVSCGTDPFPGVPQVATWPTDASKLLELDSNGHWQPIAEIPEAGTTLFVINHGWNDGPSDGGGVSDDDLSDLARLVHSTIPTAHIYMWHWGDGDSVKSDANPNGKNGFVDFAAILKYSQDDSSSTAAKIADLFIGDQYFHDEINKTWSNAQKNGKDLGKVMKTLGLTPDYYDIHMIGHSFGGVVCAEAAKIINANAGGQKVKQLTTLDTPGLPWPHAVDAIKPELAQRVETIFYWWATDLSGFGGPAQSGDNLLNLHITPFQYPPKLDETGFAPLHSRAIEWYIDSVNNSASCTPDYYGFNWSFARTDKNPNWPSGLITGRMAEKMDALGCIEPWLPERVKDGIVKTAVVAKDNCVSAATWTAKEMKIVGGYVGGVFESSLQITSILIQPLSPMTMRASAIVPLAEGEPNTTAGGYKQIAIPLNAQNLELNLRFTSVVEGHFLAVTIDGKNVLLIDPYAEGVSDTFKTYFTDVSEYAGKTVTLQIALQGASQEQTVVLIDSLQFTETTIGADINEDGRVDLLDVIMLSEYWLGPVYAKGDESDKADITRDGKINMEDFAMLADNWLWQKKGFIPGDFNGSGSVNFEDFAVISLYWMSDCDAQTRCGGADFNQSGQVDLVDLMEFAKHWLE